VTSVIGLVWSALVAGLLSLGGCATFTAAPIEPAATQRSFEARTLDSPDVQHYVISHLGARAPRQAVTTWNLESLTLAAFYFSPELDLARARGATAAVAVQTASQRPNPTLQLPFGYTTNPKRGESPYTLGLGLDIPLETAGKRGYRAAQARQLSVAAQWEVGQTAWQVRSRLRAQLLNWFAAQQHSKILDRQVQARQQVVQMLQKRLSVGAASAPQAQQEQALLTQNRLDFYKVNQQLRDAQTGAAAAVGLPVQALANVKIRFDVFKSASPELPESAVREHALLNRADVLAALADYEASQAALQLAIANQYPDFQLGPGYLFDAGAHKFALSAGAIALPLFNQNQGQIAEAIARRKEAGARFKVVQARAIGEADHAVRHYRFALSSLRLSESLLASQWQQQKAVQMAFEIGQTDRLTLALANLQVQSVALAQTDALANVQRAIGELEDAMQRPLVANPPGTQQGEPE
jgi:cobalt-zinc-cadmium efflux system outer membrane protein